MQTYSWPSKDPDDIREYSHNWTDLLKEGETLTAAEAVDPSDGLAIVGDNLNGNIQVVKLGGGIADTIGRLTLRASINGGEQVRDVGIMVKIREN